MSQVKKMLIRMMKCLFAWSSAVPMFYIIAVLMGAPVFEACSETLHFALLLATCTVLPSCLVVGSDTEALIVLYTRDKSSAGIETIVKCASVGSVLGAWLGAFPIPLDWDRPWQVWPISCVIGTVLGYLCGLVAGLALSVYKSRPVKKLL